MFVHVVRCSRLSFRSCFALVCAFCHFARSCILLNMQRSDSKFIFFLFLQKKTHFENEFLLRCIRSMFFSWFSHEHRSWCALKSITFNPNSVLFFLSIWTTLEWIRYPSLLLRCTRARFSSSSNFLSRRVKTYLRKSRAEKISWTKINNNNTIILWMRKSRAIALIRF